jgi:lactoylglutathione lyase
LKLNHLHLMVTDVRAASAFLETYFGLQRSGGNAGLTVLSDDDGFVLTLMKSSKTSNVLYPTNFHIGFFVESEARVDAVNRRLKEDGYDVAPPERQHSYSFYVAAPGGFTVELGA